MARPSSLDQLQAALKSEWKLILGSASRSRRGEVQVWQLVCFSGRYTI